MLLTEIGCVGSWSAVLNSSFLLTAGVTFQTQVAGVNNIPPAVGQPPRSMPYKLSVNCITTIDINYNDISIDVINVTATNDNGH